MKTLSIPICFSLLFACASQHIVHSSFILILSQDMKFEKGNLNSSIPKVGNECKKISISIKRAKSKESFYWKNSNYKKNGNLNPEKVHFISKSSSDGFYPLHECKIAIKDTSIATLNIDTILDRIEGKATICIKQNGITQIVAENGKTAFSAKLEITDSLIKIMDPFSNQLDTIINK
jgi:hypothetical protein